MVITVLLAAWLISLVAQVHREVMKARRRGQGAIEKELRLRQMIEAMETEETCLSG